MKTKTISIYTINELDERAQEKAHHDYLSSGFDYAWLNEGMDSIKAFCADFRVDLVDWSIGTYRRGDSYIKTDATQETFRGVRPSDIRRLDAIGTNWPTGYCLDATLYAAFHNYASKHGDVKGAFDHAIDEGLRYLLNDMEYQESMEYFIELAEINEWEYLADGSQAWRCAA
jgi:hypothetical protein